MGKIAAKINRFYDLIKNYSEGAPNTRHKSLEGCHQTFLEKKESDKNQVVDYVSLHLDFYLASCGMYRGSSYLLKRDYKRHKKAVRWILDGRYESLWNYEPTDENISKAKELIFEENRGIYWRIKDSYKNINENVDISTDTLITKILMGTYGCVPAFNRYLKRGITIIKEHEYTNGAIGKDILTQSIKKVKGKTFMTLSQLAVDHKSEFKRLITNEVS